MPSRHALSWKQFDTFLKHVGCEHVREKGDHRIYWRSDLKRPIVVPRHNPLPLFVVRNNLRILGITLKELDEFFRH